MSLMELTDSELLERFNQGSNEAFVSLYNRHCPWVLGIAQRQVKNTELAKDVAQAVFLLLARKARSLTIKSTLGPWLFGTTRLTSKAALRLEARQMRLAQEAAMQRVNETTEEIWKELVDDLDDCVDELRASDREAILLRFYEQKSHEQVGRALGLTREAARKRIDRALAQLQGLLARKGVILSAAGIGEAILLYGHAPSAASAATALAVGQLLQQATLTGGGKAMQIAAAAKVSAWTTATIKIAATVAGIAVIGVGIGATTKLIAATPARTGTPSSLSATSGTHHSEVPAPGTQVALANSVAPSAPAASNVAAGQAPAAVEQADDAIRVKGQVLAPDGKPAAGAKVTASALLYLWDHAVPRRPLAQTVAGSDGRFAFSFSRREASPFALGGGESGADLYKDVHIVASAEGFGLAWKNWQKTDANGDLVLQLVPDDAPIEGRLVMPDGKAAANASIVVDTLGPADAPCTGLPDDTKDIYLTLPLHSIGMTEPIVTDSMGRFRIPGIGRDRVATIVITGANVGAERVGITTRYIKTKESVRDEPNGSKSHYWTYGAKCEIKALPAQSVEGMVKDAATQQPLAGVTVTSHWFGGPSFGVDPLYVLTARTDARGHYRLDGFPAGAANRILVIPGDDQPYLARMYQVPSAAAGQAASVNVELHRGIWITGRITDKNTGAPIAARMEWSPMHSNKFAQAMPEFGKPNYTSVAIQGLWNTKPDGTYKLVGIPGKSVIGASNSTNKYRQGVGFESISERRGGSIPTYGLASAPNILNTMKELDIQPGVETVTADLQMDPGGSLHVNVLDPEGKPATGIYARGQEAEAYGVWDSWVDKREPSGSFDAVAMGDDETRVLVVRDPVARIGKVQGVKMSDATSGQVTVQLAPYAKAKGKLIDPAGHPLAGVMVQASAKAGDWRSLPVVKTDEEGVFQMDLLPGASYSISAQDRRLEDQFVNVAGNLSIAAGENKDLGEIKIPLAGKK